MNPQDPYQQQNPNPQPPEQPSYPSQQPAQPGQYQQPYGQTGQYPPQYGQPQYQYPPQPMAPPASGPTPRAAILWFCSPAIAIGASIFLSILSRAFVYSDVARRVFNIITILCGLAFVILLVLGPVMGIITISRHKK